MFLSIEEFYQKINFYLSREKSKDKLNQLIERLLNALSIMDKNFAEKLKNKFSLFLEQNKENLDNQNHRTM